MILSRLILYFIVIFSHTLLISCQEDDNTENRDRKTTPVYPIHEFVSDIRMGQLVAAIETYQKYTNEIQKAIDHNQINLPLELRVYGYPNDVYLFARRLYDMNGQLDLYKNIMAETFRKEANKLNQIEDKSGFKHWSKAYKRQVERFRRFIAAEKKKASSTAFEQVSSISRFFIRET